MRNQILIVSLALLCFSATSYSQSLYFSGPVSNSLAYVKVFDDTAWATLSNVSCLSTQKSWSVNASYQLRFNMEELSTRVASLVAPTKYGTFAALLFQSGYSKSNYSRYALSYSRLFGDKISAGFQFNYLTHQLENSALVGNLYSSLGITVQTTESIDIGVFIQNAEQAKLNYYETEYIIPSFFNIALRWSTVSHFLIIGEFEKETEHDPVYKTAVQFSFKDKLMVRGGVKGKPVEFTFGAGCQLSRIAIDVGFSHHQELGLTSSAGISYLFNRKKP